MVRVLVPSAMVATIIVIAPSAAWGPATTATILGTVADMSGVTVADAQVQVRNVATGIVQSVATDSAGRFRVPDLGIGDYEVRASPMRLHVTRAGEMTLQLESDAGDQRRLFHFDGPKWQGGEPQLQGDSVASWVRQYQSILTTAVDDPQYLAETFITSEQFKFEPDSSKWKPTPYQAK